jgi:tRNA(Ile)-lysidine synthase
MLCRQVSGEPKDFDWRRAAERLAARLPPERWGRRVVAWVEARPAGEPLAVACSGGPDSLAVLLLTWAVWPSRRAACWVLHFNHRLRGAESDGDEAFCRAVAENLGVEFRSGAVEWPVDDPETSPNETALREARLGWLGAATAQIGAVGVLFGHQRDDVVETMLLRLARGSGAAGLAAPRPVAMHGNRVHLRPLLPVARAEIEAALAQVGVVPREDRSNRSEQHLRNRLRAQVVPAWRAALPAGVDLGAAVASARAALEEDEAALQAWVDRVVPPPESLRGPLPLHPLRSVPPAVVRRAVQRWWHAQGLEAEGTRGAMDALMEAIAAGRPGRASAGMDRWVRVSGEALVVETAADLPLGPWCARLVVGTALALPDGGWLTAEATTVDAGLLARLAGGAVDPAIEVVLGFAEARPAPFLVRTWQPGDRYRPLGLLHATKLQDQFVDRRIPRIRRGCLPVVEGPGGEIAWVPGLPSAERYRVAAGTCDAVRLTYRQPDPPSAPQHG